MGLTPTRVRRALVALAVTYFALWACAPVTAMPPPTPMVEGRQHELGLEGGVGVVPAYDPDEARGGITCGLTCNGVDGLLWYRGAFKRLEVGMALGGGTTYGAGIGGHLRLYGIDSDHVRLGGRLDGGLVYAGFGIPFAVGSGPVWVYTEPWVGTNLWSVARIPLGVNLTSNGGFSVSAEGAVSPDFGGGWKLHAGLGVAVQL